MKTEEKSKSGAARQKCFQTRELIEKNRCLVRYILHNVLGHVCLEFAAIVVKKFIKTALKQLKYKSLRKIARI
jgi:hypothetical protein